MSVKEITPDQMFILSEICAERRRQDEKFGEQNHPFFSSRNKAYPEELTLKNQLKLIRERIQEAKYGWFDILVEEICEAFLETEPEKQRKEMIHVAAVAVAIIEYLDRRKPE